MQQEKDPGCWAAAFYLWGINPPEENVSACSFPSQAGPAAEPTDTRTRCGGAKSQHGDKAMPPAPEKPWQGQSWEGPQDLSINTISTKGNSRGSCLIFSVGWGGLAVLAG